MDPARSNVLPLFQQSAEPVGTPDTLLPPDTDGLYRVREAEADRQTMERIRTYLARLDGPPAPTLSAPATAPNVCPICGRVCKNEHGRKVHEANHYYWPQKAPRR